MWSRERTSCKKCGKELQSINGKKINIILIIVWALTGKLIVINTPDSLLVMLLVTLFVGCPLFLFTRAGLVEYKISDDIQTAS